MHLAWLFLRVVITWIRTSRCSPSVMLLALFWLRMLSSHSTSWWWIIAVRWDRWTVNIFRKFRFLMRKLFNLIKSCLILILFLYLLLLFTFIARWAIDWLYLYAFLQFNTLYVSYLSFFRRSFSITVAVIRSKKLLVTLFFKLF